MPLAQHPLVLTAAGGQERADSVLSALKTLENQADDCDWILVHDAARPCISASDIHKLMASLKNDPVGGILATPSHDTLKQVLNGEIQHSLNRRLVWRALTPQMFRYGVLKRALEQTQANPAVTDEASAVELIGLTAKIVEGRADNLKITQAEDLFLAQFYLEQQT